MGNPVAGEFNRRSGEQEKTNGFSLILLTAC
jgi:hypothetical protein